jgi:Secretion system C-terminal sorting domain
MSQIRRIARLQHPFEPSFSPLTLFPNPVSGFIHVAEVEGVTEETIFEIYDINGILVQRKTLINKALVLDVKDLPPSVYWLILRGKDGIRAAKFSKL